MPPKCEQATQVVVEQLKTLAKPCDSTQEIAHVAAISANNDMSESPEF